jgi:hypothetical protein
LKTFNDVPDEIKQVFVVKSWEDFIELSWDAPDCNNKDITEYTIYRSDKTIFDIGTPDMSIQKDDENSSNHNCTKVATVKPEDKKGGFYRLEGLQPSCAYYVLVTATNELGEGYKTETPQMVLTQVPNFSNAKNLYVWGSNRSSEIGLTEELVAKHKAFYVKKVYENADKNFAILTKTVEHTGF